MHLCNIEERKEDGKAGEEDGEESKGIVRLNELNKFQKM